MRPPKWWIKGEQEGTGVKVDNELELEQKNLAFWHCGKFEFLKNGLGAAG